MQDCAYSLFSEILIQNYTNKPVNTFPSKSFRFKNAKKFGT